MAEAMEDPRPDALAWLLGREAAQRRRASQSLMVLGVYAAYSLIHVVEVALGLLDARAAALLVALALGGGAVFYGLIRSGWNQRLRRDRALTMPQGLWAVAVAALAYALGGPARAGLLLVLTTALVFCIFALRPAQVRQLAAVAFVLLCGAMGWRLASAGDAADPRVDGVLLAFAALSIAFVAMLAERIGAMRERLEQQRRDLEQALSRIRMLATCDELTGLLNRRAALDRLRGEAAVRERGGPVLTLALIDLDHFKQVNDTRGHAAGDAVLRGFAELARGTLRTGDSLARWGGEEFLLMLPGSTPAEAVEVLERLRQRLLAAALVEAEPTLRVSFSAGVAACVGPRDLEAAIERADQAMYAAKQAGRGRTVLAPAGESLAA